MTTTCETLLRSSVNNQLYAAKEDSQLCFMCVAGKHVIIKSYKHWHIVENAFPYDNVADTHHILCPKRHVHSFPALFKDEESELWMIKYMLNKRTEYDSILENFNHAQSQPGHVHLHLLRWKLINPIT